MYLTLYAIEQVARHGWIGIIFSIMLLALAVAIMAAKVEQRPRKRG